MIPIEKVQDIIAKHNNLEKDLSSSNIDPKLFAQKSKEYSNLGNIVSFARDYLNFDREIKDLENINNYFDVSIKFWLATKVKQFRLILSRHYQSYFIVFNSDNN